MTNEHPKYSQVEHERRFLVIGGLPPGVEPDPKQLEDKYLHQSRMRLRVLTDTNGGHKVMKLTKKYVSPSPYYQAITTLQLSETELALFDRLEGDRLKKTRHYQRYRNHLFAIDVFHGPHAGLVLCEVEAPDLTQLMALQLPPYATLEVTEDPFFRGGSLSKVQPAELKAKLASIAPPPAARAHSEVRPS